MSVLTGLFCLARKVRPAIRGAAPSRPTLLLLLCALAPQAVTAAAARAQVLGDWQIVYSDSAFDYLVTPRGLGPADPDRYGTRVLRVTASRMLVRYIDRTRLRISAARGRAGAPIAGYDRFASSTYLLDVDCAARTAALIEGTDFNDDGDVLARTRLDRRMGPTIDGWTADGMERLIDWACTQRSAVRTTTRRSDGQPR